MKTLLIILSLLLTNLFASTELSWVDDQVQAIKPARVGMNRHQLSIIKDPFIFLKKNRGKEDKKEQKQIHIARKVQDQNSYRKIVTSNNSYSLKQGLNLEAILNKSVMINGIWYKLRANVHGYTVSYINKNSVLLTKNKKSLLLTTKTHNTKIKFQNK